jgi:hypothetical protein
VFLTREDDIVCIHEPFSDAYHWGPEYLSERYQNVEKLRTENGYEDYTYHMALKIINDANTHVRVPEVLRLIYTRELTRKDNNIY